MAGYQLVENNDGSGLYHWEGINEPEYGLLPQGVDVGIDASYVPDAAYLSGTKNPPMPFLRNGAEDHVREGNHNANGHTTGYVPLPGEAENHTAGN